MDRKWKKIDSKVLYKDKYGTIVLDKVIRPDGVEDEYWYSKRIDGVIIIAFDGENIIFVVEHRYPVGENLIELPMGGIKNGEILKSAKEELFEETGIIANEFENIGAFYISPGYDTVLMNVFVAKNLDIKKIGKDMQENDEAIVDVITKPVIEVKKMIIENKIKCGLTLAALNKFFIYLEIK